MALQDVCGFQESPFFPRSTRPTSLSISSHNFTLGTYASDIKTSSCPLHLLLPPPPRPQQKILVRGVSRRPPRPLRPFPLAHGTTTLGFVFQGGAIAAADTRASAGGLIACPEAQKVMPIHSHLVVTTSGSGADCMLWERILTREIRLYQLRHRRKLSVNGAAKLLSFMLHPFKGTEVCVALTLCGWDGDETVGDHVRTTGKNEMDWVTHEPLLSGATDRNDTAKRSGSDFSTSGIPTQIPSGPEDEICREAEGKNKYGKPSSGPRSDAGGTSGPRVCYVCSDGLLLRSELISVGSGSPYAYSVLDDGWRWTLSVDEAEALAREAVYRATHRDAYSGNNVDLFHITAQGWRRRKRENLREEYHRERQERERERLNRTM